MLEHRQFTLLHSYIKETKPFFALSTSQSAAQPALGAEGGQDRRGKGQMQQDSTHITLQGLHGGRGPFPTEAKLLQCPPSLEEAAEPAGSPEPQAPAPLTEPALQLPGASHGSVPPPCRAGSSSRRPHAPWAAHGSVLSVLGVHWGRGLSTAPCTAPPLTGAQRIGENGIKVTTLI